MSERVWVGVLVCACVGVRGVCLCGYVDGCFYACLSVRMCGSVCAAVYMWVWCMCGNE